MAKKSTPQVVASADERVRVGIVMPIDEWDNCPSLHWTEVRTIISEAVRSIDKPTFEPSLVSQAPDVGLIQKRIVTNLYEMDIVICDVSGRNPNVMFELGMRLAFDKPVVLLKDEQTAYSFDSSPIEI
jgi:hypothetical protein